MIGDRDAQPVVHTAHPGRHRCIGSNLIVLRFALRPRWLVAHVFVLGAVVTFALAGTWQLRRLDERRTNNAQIERRQALEVVSLADALDAGEATYRRVSARGTFDTSEEAVLVGRGREGLEGNHVLTPLVTADGAVLVDRGWVPPQSDRPPVPQARPPSGKVSVTGYLYRSEGRGPFGTSGERTEVVARIDVARLAQGSDHRYATTDLYLLLSDQDPAPEDLPRPVPPLELSEGSHRIYAVQWFLFIPTALVVYAALLRRGVRRPV